jgi:hypothetical protein
LKKNFYNLSFTFSAFLQLSYPPQHKLNSVQAIDSQINTGKINQETLYKLLAAYLHTMPLEELLEHVERARRDAQLRYVVIYGAACSYCLGRAERLEGSYLRSFALELRERLALTLTAFVTSILTQSHGRLDVEEATEPPLRQIINMLQQVMCKHDAEKLAISVLEIYKDSNQGERSSH